MKIKKFTNSENRGCILYNINNKAFTLIELLAIIVILAIIAVITIPIILNVIENSRKGAAIDSAYGYKDAIEKYYLTELSKDTDFKLDGDYIVENDGSIISKSDSTKKHSISLLGTKPSGGYLTIYSDSVTNGCIVIWEYQVIIEEGKIGEAIKGNCEIETYTDGKIVYFNPKSGVACTEKDYKGNDDGETQSKTGNISGCMKWYAYSENEDGTVNMILDHNTALSSSWVSQSDYQKTGNNPANPSDVGIEYPGGIEPNYDWNTDAKKNAKGPITLLKKLKDDTDEWSDTLTRSDKYTAYEINEQGQIIVKYTINYSGYKARLITAQEVADITEANKSTEDGGLGWNEKGPASSFYFGRLENTWSSITRMDQGTNLYAWLFDHTYNVETSAGSCEFYGCNVGISSDSYGYFTSSPVISSSSSAWIVGYFGSLETADVIGGGQDYGVRPVITVSKEKLSQ